MSQIDDNNVLEKTDIRLLYGDFRRLSEDIPEDAVDLIFTDPPYNRESLHIYSDLGRIAARVLRPGGSLITFIGQYALPEILDRLRESNLTWWWIMFLKHGGQHAAMYQRRVFVECKPLFWFVKGSLSLNENTNTETDFVADFIQSEPPDKQYHEWAQSTVEAEYVISKLTKKGGLVFDPFLGSGTTALAAHKLGRSFIGMEIDEAAIANAKARLAKEMSPMPE